MPGYGFPRKLRLTEPDQFKLVFAHTELKVSNRYFLILARHNQIKNGRIGLVIGKKNLPKAFQRNRIKRLLRNSYRLNQELLRELDIVILARSNMSGLDNQQITKIIQDLWRDLVKKSTTNTHNPSDHKQSPLVAE